MNNSSFTNTKAIFFDTGDTLYSSEAMEAAYPQKLVELLVAARHISADEAKTLLKETTGKLKGTLKHVTKVRTMAELGFSAPRYTRRFARSIPKIF